MEELFAIKRLDPDNCNSSTLTRIYIGVTGEDYIRYYFEMDDPELHARFVKIGEDLLHKTMIEMLEALKDAIQEEEEEPENEDLALPF